MLNHHDIIDNKGYSLNIVNVSIISDLIKNMLSRSEMMNKNIAIYLVFVTLLALLFNLSFVLFFLNFESVLSLIGINSTWFIGIVIAISILGAVSAFLFSEVIARFMLGVTLIKQPSTYLEKWLFTSVERQSRQLGILMPQIGVFYASDLNAFTAGWGQKHAMFAVSSGLLESLNENELEAVIGHELAHIENGDMVSLSIAQGMLFSLIELPARLFGFVIDSFILRGNSQCGVAYFTVYWFCMILVGILPHFIVMWFSRQREFSADITSATLNGSKKMISALQRLSNHKKHPLFLKQSVLLGNASFVLEGLVDNVGSVKNIFSSHPSLKARINIIQKNVIDEEK